MRKILYIISLGLLFTNLTTSCTKTNNNLFLEAFSGAYKIKSMSAVDYTLIGEGRFKDFSLDNVGLAQLNTSATDDANPFIISQAVADRSRPFAKMREIGAFVSNKTGYSLFWQPATSGNNICLSHLANGKLKSCCLQVAKISDKVQEWSYSEKTDLGAVTYKEVWKLEKQSF
ncbi:MAG: hypothetical protein RLZZ628_415 [Bacteroidota bacterium]